MSPRSRSAGQPVEPIDRIASVASFFVSRVDTLIDEKLQQKIEAAAGDGERNEASLLFGKAGVANAKIAYAKYQEIFSSTRWLVLEDAGRPRPALSLGQHQHEEPRIPRRDVRRAADRRGHNQHDAPDHDSMPSASMASCHSTLEEDVDEAFAIIRQLEEAGIDFKGRDGRASGAGRKALHRLLSKGERDDTAEA